MEKLISFIIPVYNAEKHLKDCVDSIINNSVSKEQYEVILVNDGSTDSSSVICQDYTEKYDNIQYCCQNNQGASGARNTGLRNAKGRYICFVDSDDVLLKGSLEEKIKLAELGTADIYNFRMRLQRQDGTYRDEGQGDNFEVYKDYDGEYCITKGLIISSACCNMYNRSFLKTHDLTFTLNIINEDVDLNFRAFFYAKKVIFTGITTYVYNWNGSSLNRSPRTSERIKKMLHSDIIIAKHIKDFASGISSIKSIDFFEKHANSIICSAWLQIVSSKILTKADKILLYNEIRDKRLIPIKGKTKSYKSNLLKCLVQNNTFTQGLIKVGSLFVR